MIDFSDIIQCSETYCLTGRLKGIYFLQFTARTPFFGNLCSDQTMVVLSKHFRRFCGHKRPPEKQNIMLDFTGKLKTMFGNSLFDRKIDRNILFEAFLHETMFPKLLF